MLERSMVVQRRPGWFVLVAIAAAIPIAVLALHAGEPEGKPFAFVAPSIPCDEVVELGVCVAPHRDGALIVRVHPGSLATDKGWRPGDVIEEVDCQDVRTAEQLRTTLADGITWMKVLRDGRVLPFHPRHMHRSQ